MSDEKVLVSGASGFIALHLLDALLSEGYHVIGTVRSQDKADRISKSFKKLYPYCKLDLVIVPDIGASGAFDETFKSIPDIQHVVHTASPFSFGQDKSMEESFLIPATQGTKNILESTKKYGKSVKRFVLTSSFAAIINIAHAGDRSFVHTEKTWNPIEWKEAREDERSSYMASKKLAEKLAWDFLEENKGEINFTLTTVNPPYVMGPQMFDWGVQRGTLNTSAEIVSKAVHLAPDFEGPFDTPKGLAVDVRDVALLHVLPLRNEKLAGQRLFPVSGTGQKSKDYEDGSWNLQRTLDILNKNFPELRGKIPKGKIIDNKPYLANHSSFNNDITTKLTGVEFKPFEETIVDSAKQILEVGSRTKSLI
ncbi:LAMI_0B00914g1_1 [Lachancea mirantina]|uniref:LAMI_0B00914g1_1 n=1 Tax=Lachancea mirantina TaxID=1230905 RepID=A0A1G4IT49_9SACH|nr:LAMI_0B00914g1_1 [Lachancea mirantina]